MGKLSDAYVQMQWRGWPPEYAILTHHHSVYGHSISYRVD